MKKILYTFFLLLFLINFSDSKAQENEVLYAGLQFDHFNTYQRNFTAGGLGFEYRFNKNFSIGYSILAGQSSPKAFYLYTGIGQMAFGYMIGHFKPDKLGIYLMIFAVILPESFNLRIPLNNKHALSLFISPYGFEYIKNNDISLEKGYVSFELGMKYHYKLSPGIELIPQLGIKKFYGKKIDGFSIGTSVMFGKGEKKKT